jgi:hypothetical protein
MGLAVPLDHAAGSLKAGVGPAPTTIDYHHSRAAYTFSSIPT